MFFHLDWTMEQLRGPARATAVQLNAKLFCEPMPRAESPGERRRRYIQISSFEVRKSGLGLWTYVASDELRQWYERNKDQCYIPERLLENDGKWSLLLRSGLSARPLQPNIASWAARFGRAPLENS